MNNIANLRIGDKVHYQPTHYGDKEWENGIIKEIRDNVFKSVLVVYNCNGNWDNYINYTSAKTNLCDLQPGWRFE
jgi:hypothetical protein